MCLDVLRRELARGAETIGSLVAGVSPDEARLRPAPDWRREYRAPFGPITAGDLLASWAAHDLLHTRQLVELRRARLLGQTAGHSTQYAGDW